MAHDDSGTDNADRSHTCPLQLGALIDEIDALVTQYVSFYDRGLSMVIALWIINTYTFMHFDYCGYLAIRSATPRCGKSRLLRLIHFLANGNPAITTIPTAAVLFRSSSPVLLLDEVDFLRNQDKERFAEVLAVLNTGFERDGIVRRVDRPGHQLSDYPTYGPKALSGIEALADTLSDRAFQIRMIRARDRMPRLNRRVLESTFTRIRAALNTWAKLHADDIRAAYERLPNTIPDLEPFDDRFQDISEPLLVLSGMADAERIEGPYVLPRILSGLRASADRREPSSRERSIVAFLELVGERLGESEDLFLPSNALLFACGEREDLSHIETSKGLAAFVKYLDLRPVSNGVQRGYHITQAWYLEWHERYPGHSQTQPIENLFSGPPGVNVSNSLY